VIVANSISMIDSISSCFRDIGSKLIGITVWPFRLTWHHYGHV